jgi:alkanesulfonate monooxygenase SsuD/methylene tetrahydromethanopterin reductase-like flavin-dependent oxidoreductase (luciferase family)
MVTPITRRRPQRLARESVAVDRLSKGRLIVGLGLGVDSGGELTRFGEVVDAVERGERLDEGADLLLALWTGERVEFRGRHFTVDGVQFLPRPVQHPHPPLWFAARNTAVRPLRRAGRLGDGLHAIEVDRGGLARMLDLVVAERGSLDGFDVACNVEPGTDPSVWAGCSVTWVMHAFEENASLSDVLRVAEAGPPRP